MPPLPPARPRLIGLDLDGTVLDDRGALRESMLEALLACRAAGIELAFLTGRRPGPTRQALERYLDRAAICTNSGCLLWDYPDFASLCAPRLFPRELLETVVDTLAPWSLNLYHDCGPDEAGRILLLRKSTPEFAHNRELYGRESPVIHSLDELPVVLGERQLTQLALPCNREMALELEQHVVEQCGDALLTLVVRWPLVPCHALELYHPDAHKGRALEHFAARLGIPQAEVLAAGDDRNDIAMLRWAGWAVAMPHSEDDVRAVADVVLSGADRQLALAEYLQRVAN
jgi:Cof subfamily protein (haloacid dehalogenase superfamily)